MNSSKRTARIVGLLFIIGTAAGVLGGLFFTEPILADPDYLMKASANASQIASGAILVLVMGFAVAMIPVVMYPIFRRHNEILALGSVVFRGVLEAVCYMAIVVNMLLLVTLSQEYVKAGVPEASYYQTMGTLLVASEDWINLILAIVFSLGALMLYYLFYVTRLVPRWLSGWGFIGAILYLAAPIIIMFDPQDPTLSLDSGFGMLMIPLALQEMVFAIWLIAKGFSLSSTAAEA